MTTSLFLLAAVITGDPAAPIESPIAFFQDEQGILSLDIDRLTRLAVSAPDSIDLSKPSSPRPLLAAMAVPFLPGKIESTGPNLIRISRDNLLFTGTVGDARNSTSLSMEVLCGPDRNLPEHSFRVGHGGSRTNITLQRHEELHLPDSDPVNVSWRVMLTITEGPNREVHLATTRIDEASGERRNRSVIAPWGSIVSRHRDVLTHDVHPLFREAGILMPPFTDELPTEGQN